MAKGDPISCVIQADADAVPAKAGWIVRLTFDDFTDEMAFNFGSGEGNPLAYANQNEDDARLILHITRKGFDAAGNPTTYSIKAYGRSVIRRAFPNHLTRSQGSSGGDAWADVALSTMIYDEDVIDSVEVKAGLSRDASGTPDTTESNAATLTGGSVTNSSDRTYPVAFGRWSELDGVKDGALLPETFEPAFFPRCKGGIMAVKFTATGVSSSQTATAIATGPTKKLRTGTNQYAEAWKAELDLSAFTQGEAVTVRAQVFPRYGNAASELDTSDHTDADLACFGQNSLNCWCNRTGELTMYAAVDHAAPSGTPVVSASKATAKLDPFGSIGEAIAAAGSTDVVVLNDGPILGTPPGTQLTKNHIVEVYPDDGLDLTLDLDANSEDTHTPYLVYRGFTIDKSEDNGTLDGDGVNHLWFEECVGAFTTNTTESSNRTIENFVLCRLFNCTGVWGRSVGGPQFYQQSTNKIRIFADGTLISGDNQSLAIDVFWGLIACKSHPDHPDWQLSDTDNQSVDCDHNFLCDFCDFRDFNGSGSNVSQVSMGKQFSFQQWSFTCSLFERGGANDAGNWFVGDDQDSDHVLFHHFGSYGAQVSLSYNDDGSVAKSGINWEFVGFANNHETWAKGDIFASDAGLTGAMALHYGVDCFHNHWGAYQDDLTADVEGRGGSDATVGSSGLFVDDQSASGGQGGNGDYTPAEGSPLLNRLDVSRAGFDFLGNVIKSDGTGSAGPIQPDSTPPEIDSIVIGSDGVSPTVNTNENTTFTQNARIDLKESNDPSDATVYSLRHPNPDASEVDAHSDFVVAGSGVIGVGESLYAFWSDGICQDEYGNAIESNRTIGEGVLVTNNSTQDPVAPAPESNARGRGRSRREIARMFNMGG